MNTLARYLAWTFWYCTFATSNVYFVVAIDFLSQNFNCKDCEDVVATFNDGLSAVIIGTLLLVFIQILITGTFMIIKKRYVEAMCIGSSFTLSLCMLMFSILLHASTPLLNEKGTHKKQQSIKATYIVGYVLSGLYGFWMIVVLLARKGSEIITNTTSADNNTNNV